MKNIKKYSLGIFAAAGLFLGSCEKVEQVKPAYQSSIGFEGYSEPLSYDIIKSTSNTFKVKVTARNLSEAVVVSPVVLESSDVKLGNELSISPKSVSLNSSNSVAEFNVIVKSSALSGPVEKKVALGFKSSNENIFPSSEFSEVILEQKHIDQDVAKGIFEGFVWSPSQSDAAQWNQDSASWSYIPRLEPHEDLDKMIIKNFWNASGDGGRDITVRFEGSTEGKIYVDSTDVVDAWWSTGGVIKIKDPVVGSFSTDKDGLLSIKMEYILLAADWEFEKELLELKQLAPTPQTKLLGSYDAYDTEDSFDDSGDVNANVSILLGENDDEVLLSNLWNGGKKLIIKLKDDGTFTMAKDQIVDAGWDGFEGPWVIDAVTDGIYDTDKGELRFTYVVKHQESGKTFKELYPEDNWGGKCILKVVK